MFATLFRLYVTVIAVVCGGILVRRLLPERALPYLGPQALGRFMFWVGTPIGLVGFMRKAELPSVALFLPLFIAVILLVAWGSAQACLRLIPRSQHWSRERHGSFKLAAIMSNTGYLGYPICLAVAGQSVFGWVLLYDLLATLFGNYMLGVWLANRHGRGSHLSTGKLLFQMFYTPALWGFIFGLILQPVLLPAWLDTGLSGFAWGVVGLSLVLIGMRLAQLRHWGSLQDIVPALGIKLLFIPLVMSLLVLPWNLPGTVKLILVLQAGMPCAFSTLILAEEYRLDRDATVTAIASSSIFILFTLPIWVGLWGRSIG